MEPRLKMQLHYPGMSLPVKAHPSDAGFDLTCMEVIDKGNQVYFLDTGVSLEPPAGFYVELYPRSSVYKTNFFQANSVGIIDPDYRGRIYFPFRYLGQGDGLAEAKALIGTRIGQLVVKRQEQVQLDLSEHLNDTHRGENGFGSTGK